MTLARSTPSRARSFSIAEMVAWGMPVSLANSFWLYPCNSLMIRTDFPTDTFTAFVARLKFLILRPPIPMRADARDLKDNRISNDFVDHAVL